MGPWLVLGPRGQHVHLPLCTCVGGSTSVCARFSLWIGFQTPKGTSERGTLDGVTVEFIIQTGTLWSAKRSAINIYTRTTAINWAVLGKMGCALQKILGSKAD